MKITEKIKVWMHGAICGIIIGCMAATLLLFVNATEANEASASVVSVSEFIEMHPTATTEEPEFTFEDAVVAAVIIGEATSEGTVGMTAVMHTIHNRSKERRQSYYEVVTAKSQYSCINGQDPKRYAQKKMYDINYAEALQLAYDFRNGKIGPDPTMGAQHYHVYKGPTKVSPYWTAIELGGDNEKAWVSIKHGLHAFVVDVD
jgi:spore germination cell wall hydrolase CwlJ-like protein